MGCERAIHSLSGICVCLCVPLGTYTTGSLRASNSSLPPLFLSLSPPRALSLDARSFMLVGRGFFILIICLFVPGSLLPFAFSLLLFPSLSLPPHLPLPWQKHT